MAEIGTPQRRAFMAQALRDRGYIAAADKCLADPQWEEWYSHLLGSLYTSLTLEEQRRIYPWNFQD